MCRTLINDEGTGKSPLLLFMISTEKLQELAETFIENMDGVFLVDAFVKGSDGNAKVTVLLDGDHGVDIDQCGDVSRGLGNYLEEHELMESKYRLEVSSAGIDYPLKHHRQYVKNIGRDLQVSFLDGEEVKGKLKEVNKDSFILNELIERPKMAPKYKEEDVEVTFTSINKAKVLISFN